MNSADAGYRSGPSAALTCVTREDCRDDNANVYGGFDESTRCTDGWDNDCDYTREADYDGWTNGLVNSSAREGTGTAPHGDIACKVGIRAANGITITPSTVSSPAACAANITVSCVANVGSIRSIKVYGPTACSFTSWSSTTASFTCDRPADGGSYTYSCYVDVTQSYALNDATYDPSASASVTVACGRTVTGYVLDAVTQGGIPGAVVSRNDSAVTALTDAVGLFTFTGVDAVPIGVHDFLASKDGYFTERRTAINVSAEPTPVDFNLTEEQCTSSCTYKGVCDYNKCLGQNGCPAFGEFDLESPAAFFQTCQGAPNGTRREYSETEMATCCLGPVESKALTSAPMAIESCASQLIPFERIVNYNGKPHLLTVLSYRPCS